MSGYDASLDAENRVDFRTELQAEREEALRQQIAQQALDQQQAIEKAAQQRQAMLERMRIDFDEQAQKLGDMHLDGDRYWGSLSTPEKIGTLFLVALAGGGGPENNAVLHALNNRINQDIEAQKFAYKSGLDQLQSRQTAFGLAMDQFHDEDAAAAQARAAALAYANARLGAMEAQWKGTEAANKADFWRGKIENERMKTLAEGFRYVPPSVAGERYKMLIRGQEVPGLLDVKGAQEAALKYGVEPMIKTDEILTKGGVDLGVKKLEVQQKRQEKAQEREDQRAKFVSEQETKAKLPEMENKIDTARRALLVKPITTGERVSNFMIAPWKGGVSYKDSPAFYQFLHGKEAAHREQAWATLRAEKQHELSGAAVTPSEQPGIYAMLEGANDQESRLWALRMADDAIAAQRRAIRGGVSDAGASFDENQERSPQKIREPNKMPGSTEYHGKK